MTLDEMIAVLQAAKEGKRIEWQRKGKSGEPWLLASSPVFNFSETNYRVATPVAPQLITGATNCLWMTLKRYYPTFNEKLRAMDMDTKQIFFDRIRDVLRDITELS